jgi:hypothetical protein
MEQCKADAKASGKRPFLMLRENGMKKDTWYIFLPVTFAQYLSFMNYLPIRFTDEKGELVGFPSEVFFNKISYNNLKFIYSCK